MTTELAEHSDRSRFFLEMHGNEFPMNLLDFPKRHGRGPQRLHLTRSNTLRPLQKRRCIGRQRQIRRIDTLETEQPTLEVPGQRVDRCPRDQRFERRGAQSKQAFVRIRFGGPFVDQLGKVVAIASASGFDADSGDRTGSA